MPAWMQIPSPDETNSHSRLTNDRSSSVSKLRISNHQCLLSTPNNFDQRIVIKENRNHHHHRILLVLSASETSKEKELLKHMGWNDDLIYEITDQDKEEYEKRIQLLPKTDNRLAKLISALYRRALPCFNIQDISQLDKFDSTSDDNSSDD